MRVRILLLLAVLAIGTNGTMALPVSIANTLTANYGTLGYSISTDGTQSGQWSVQEHLGTSDADPTYTYITGGDFKDATQFTGSITATTKAGDQATSGVTFGKGMDKSTEVDDFNLYGYMTPNLAWTGTYTGTVTSNYISFIGNAYTRGSTSNSKGYQGSALGPWDTIDNNNNNNNNNGNTNPDFTASQVYTTSQAGGSEDNIAFNVGTQNSWGGKGTYAMSTMEYGSFGIAATSRANKESWNIEKPHADSNFQGGIIVAASNTLTTIGGGPLTFIVNSVAMNYADADIEYSNTDLGVSGASCATMNNNMGTVAIANDYPGIANSQHNSGQNNVPLTSFANVFSYGYINVPQNIITNIVYY
jgi:hypothetical protein